MNAPAAHPAPRPARRVVDVVFIVALLAVAAVPLWPVYQTRSIVTLVAVGIATGTLLAVLGARFRLPFYAMGAVTAVAFLLIAVPLANPAAADRGFLPTAQGLREVAIGSVTAWRQMLTARLPFGMYEVLAVPALIVVLVMTVISVSVVLRSKQPFWALLGPLAVMTFAIAFGPSSALWPMATGAALGVLVLLWAAVGSAVPAFAGQKVTEKVRGTRLLAAAAIIAVGVTVAAGVDSAAPEPHRQTLQNAVKPPIDVHDLTSPLISYRQNVIAPGKNKALMTVTGLPDGARIRLATLDQYNGLVYAAGIGGSSGAFERIPLRIDSAAKGKAATVTISLSGYSGTWVPTVGQIRTIKFSPASQEHSFFYNQLAASGVRLGGVHSPTTYTIDTRVTSMLTDNQINALVPGTAGQADLTQVPDALLNAGHQRSSGAKTAGAKLLRLVSWLRSGYVSHGGPGEPVSHSGHAANRLASLVTTAPMLGDAEQYATAFAILARDAGFPSRVVVGYAPTPGQTVIHGKDTTAWVEVQKADGQWVAIDPNPKVRPVPDQERKNPDYVANPRTVLPPPPPVDDNANTTMTTDDDKPSPPDSDKDSWLVKALAIAKVVGISIGGVLLVTLPFWVAWLIRRIRRRRRRRRDRSRTTVSGAWQEVRDGLVDRGYDIPKTATRREIAEIAENLRINDLAERADRYVFDAGKISRADVDRYWRELKPVGRELNTVVDRRTRWRRRVTVRSLRRAMR